MHKIKSFLKFVEIQTKVASFFPFVTGTSMVIFMGFRLDPINLMLMFLSLLMIDLTTTGLNHLMDYKRAVLKTGYHYQVHNPLGKGDLSESEAQYALITMLIIGALSGIFLAFRTDVWVLLMGGLAFFIGVTYSYGPLPISRTVLGETLSGLFMGGLIPFIAFYIHVYTSNPLSLSVKEGLFIFSINYKILLPVIWVSLPLVALISNIMLANNICDRDEDIVNNRYTLPVVMGQAHSVKLYVFLVLFSYLSSILGVILGFIPITQLIVLLSFPMVMKQTKKFYQKQVKGETFILAVKNFVVFASLNLVGIMVQWLL